MAPECLFVIHFREALSVKSSKKLLPLCKIGTDVFWYKEKKNYWKFELIISMHLFFGGGAKEKKKMVAKPP